MSIESDEFENDLGWQFLFDIDFLYGNFEIITERMRYSKKNINLAIININKWLESEVQSRCSESGKPQISCEEICKMSSLREKVRQDLENQILEISNLIKKI